MKTLKSHGVLTGRGSIVLKDNWILLFILDSESM